MKIKDKIARDEIIELRREIYDLTTRLDNVIKSIPLTHTCEVCKCLLNIDDAIKGKSEIRIKKVYSRMGSTLKEYIYIPYYCHEHKPKEEKNEKQDSKRT